MIDLLGRRGMALAVVMSALLLAGCQTGGGTSPTASAGGARAIAFESIDGPPQPVFQKLVTSLSAEADSRSLRVVSREGEATYRVRGYLAASVEDGKGAVDWAWDVFDRSQTRVLRVSGTEQVGKGADVWARCDDAVLDRIAAQSLTEIAARLDGKPATRPAPAAQPAVPEEPAPVPMVDGPPVAALDAGTPPLAFAAQP